MELDAILRLLIEERDKLSKAIQVLQGSTANSHVPATKKTRRFTASQRKEMSARMKRYWAAKKKK
jgi:hypothetical protein